MRQPFSELSSAPASRSDQGPVLKAVDDRIRLGLPAAGEPSVWKRTLTSPQRELLQAARSAILQLNTGLFVGKLEFLNPNFAD